MFPGFGTNIALCATVGVHEVSVGGLSLQAKQRKVEAMKKTTGQKGRAVAFTLVELMIVVTIVAILALIAIPLYAANTTASMMSEGIAAAGTIRTALRTYYAANGSSYSGATMGNLMINLVDLQGKYFASGDYSLTNVTASTYLIKAGPPSHTNRAGMPYYSIDQNGSEQGTYYTNQ